MPNKPGVVYAVTEKHMAQLSALSAGAVLSMDLGEARFLEAICEAVWPGLRVRLENERASEVQTPGGAPIPTRFADVRILRLYAVHVKACGLNRSLLDAARGSAGGDGADGPPV